jgi:hypothetical protein
MSALSADRQARKGKPFAPSHQGKTGMRWGSNPHFLSATILTIMKTMKLHNFLLALSVLVILSVGFIYYISVNTLLQDEPLISVSDVSASYNKQINLSLLGDTKTVNLSEVIIVKNEEELRNFGKGNDIISVWMQAPSILSKDNPEAEIGLNVDSLLSNFGVTSSDSVSVYRDETGVIHGCQSMKFDITIDETTLLNDINSKSEIDLAAYINPAAAHLVEACKEYNTKVNKIISEISDTFGINTNALGEIFAIATDDFGEYYWTLTDKTSIRNYLLDFKQDYDTEFVGGNFEDRGSFIALYSLPEKGRKMNVEVTLHFIEQWMNSDMKNPIQIAHVEVNPPAYLMGKPVYDFSKKLASGQTRIDLIRNGQGNDAVYFAELGLEEIQKVIISPGQEFSYLQQIAKQPGLNRTASGRLIGIGYCNSTTTIFRAALEAGFPITDRANHAQNIASYDWGYPINTVDATFYAVPGQEIDLKFKNDLNYPVMLVYEKTQDENGFQYHYVHVLTNSAAPDRQVELHGWRKWDEYSATQFKSEFKRKVTENANIIREDSFYSQYYF